MSDDRITIHGWVNQLCLCIDGNQLKLDITKPHTSRTIVQKLQKAPFYWSDLPSEYYDYPYELRKIFVAIILHLHALQYILRGGSPIQLISLSLSLSGSESKRFATTQHDATIHSQIVMH